MPLVRFEATIVRLNRTETVDTSERAAIVIGLSWPTRSKHEDPFLSDTFRVVTVSVAVLPHKYGSFRLTNYSVCEVVLISVMRHI
jgi:hypothetical protein